MKATRQGVREPLTVGEALTLPEVLDGSHEVHWTDKRGIGSRVRCIKGQWQVLNTFGDWITIALVHIAALGRHATLFPASESPIVDQENGR